MAEINLYPNDAITENNNDESVAEGSDAASQEETVLFRHFRGYTWSQRENGVRMSWSWAYGYDIQNAVERRWVCRLCIARRAPQPGNCKASGIQNAANHLFTEHRIQAPNGEAKSRAEKQANGRTGAGLRSVADFFNLNTSKPRDQAIANALIKSFDVSRFHRLLIEWIVGDNLPFSIVDSERFRELVRYLQPSIAVTNAVLSHTGITNKIQQEYERHRGTIIQLLNRANGLIHIAFDGWTMSSGTGVYGIACFFRDEENHSYKLILGLPEISGKHSGPNIAGELLDIMKAYQITHKLGYATLDNATNNDTALQVIGGECGFVGSSRRARCFGHILNISAKALLFGSDVEMFEEELGINEAQYGIWRKRGPVGKLHNIVVDIDRSLHLSNRLRQLQQIRFEQDELVNERHKQPVQVVLDNETRWLSQLYMIRRALRLRGYITMLLAEYRNEWEQQNISRRTGQITQSARTNMPRILHTENQLQDRDWEVLSYIEVLLTCYETVLRTLEGDGQVRRRKNGFTGSYGHIWDVLLGYEMLLERLNEEVHHASDLPDGDYWKIGVYSAQTKLRFYYNKLDETPIYYAALALHPAYRWDWFEYTWREHNTRIETAKGLVADLWLAEYAMEPVVGRSENGFQDDSDDDFVEDGVRKRRRFYNPFQNHRRERLDDDGDDDTDAPIDGDEYAYWISHPERGDRRVRDPLMYWHERRHRFPRLSRMALDILTIQAMSAECERLFSAAGRMTAPLRSRLDARMLGMAQVLRSWYRSGLIKEPDIALVSIADDDANSSTYGEDSSIATAWLARPDDSGE